MKKTIITVSIILLISIMIAGGSMAWLTSSLEKDVSLFKMGTLKVEVIKSENIEDNTVKIKNIGTSEAYVRARIIPKWSNVNLSVSNVEIDISNTDWEEIDGYYYYKDPLEPNETTSNLVNYVNIVDPTEDYLGAEFTLNVVAEGFQEINDNNK